MALIECKACGKQVSENATSCPHCGEPIAAAFTGDIDSGTETFSVTEKNRISLRAVTERKIERTVNKLSSEGKTVAHIDISKPQAFRMGVTVWSNDVTITWQGSTPSPKYRDFLYKQVMEKYSSGYYNDAIKILNRLGGHLDSREKIQEIKQKQAEVRSFTKELEAHGIVYPGKKIENYYYAGIICVIFGVALIIGDIAATALAVLGVLTILVGINFLSESSNSKSEYNNQVDQYKREKNNKTNDESHEQKEVNNNEITGELGANELDNK